MYSISERVNILAKWLASHTKTKWQFSDYPRGVRPNNVQDPSIAWVAQILNWPGPIGLGASPTEATAKLEANFNVIRLERESKGESLPRPGTKIPVVFAPSHRVVADPALLDDFLEGILGFGPSDPVFVSDESSLHDFSSGDEDIERYRGLIHSRYGVEVSDIKSFVIAEILEKIRRVRAHG